MKTITFLLKLFTTLRPVLAEVIRAIKAVNEVKRMLKDSGTGAELRAALKQIFPEEKVERAIHSMAIVISHLDALGACSTEKEPLAIVLCFTKEVKTWRKPRQRQAWRELARQIIKDMNTSRQWDDTELDTALQVARGMVRNQPEPPTIAGFREQYHAAAARKRDQQASERGIEEARVPGVPADVRRWMVDNKIGRPM